jgi:hypothetical protein
LLGCFAICCVVGTLAGINATEAHHSGNFWHSPTTKVVLTANFCLALGILRLGLFQVNFEITYYAMIGVCTLGSLAKLLRVSGAICVPRCARLDEKRRHFQEGEAYTAENMFEDLTVPTAKAFVLGCTQIALTGVYAWCIYDEGRPDFMETQVYFSFHSTCNAPQGYKC